MRKKALFSLVCLVFLFSLLITPPQPIHAQTSEPPIDIPAYAISLPAPQNTDLSGYVELVNQVGGESDLIQIFQDVVYVGIGNQLVTFSLSNPDVPTPIHSILLKREPCEIVIDPPYAYLTVGMGGLKILNISDPTHPHVVGELNTGDGEFFVNIRKNGQYL